MIKPGSEAATPDLDTPLQHVRIIEDVLKPPSFHHQEPSSPQYTTPSTPQYTTPSTPQYTTPSTPQYPTPSTPQYTTPSSPQYTTPRITKYTTPRITKYSTQRTPQYTTPSIQLYQDMLPPPPTAHIETTDTVAKDPPHRITCDDVFVASRDTEHNGDDEVVVAMGTDLAVSAHPDNFIADMDCETPTNNCLTPTNSCSVINTKEKDLALLEESMEEALTPVNNNPPRDEEEENNEAKPVTVRTLLYHQFLLFFVISER